MTSQQHTTSHHHDDHQQENQEVNKIFANNTIEQVATICRQMQQDVRLTQLELRNMIGNRHRELIDSCGELVGIDKVCRELVTICQDQSNKDNHNSGLHHQSMMRNNNKNSKTAAAAENQDAADSSSSASIDQQKHESWINEQLLHSLRASSLLREQDLMDAAVQISVLERDVSLGMQSLMTNSASSSSSPSRAASTSSSSSSKLHALESTVRPLREQWNNAASKKLFAMTSAAIDHHQQEASSNSNQSRSSNTNNTTINKQHLQTLASCFQGWGLLSRGTPKEALQHLLLDNLCKNAIERINSSSSSTSEALSRCSRLLMFVAEFLLDLYKRGPHALISSTNDQNHQSGTSSIIAKSSSKTILQDLLQLDANNNNNNNSNNSNAFPRNSSSNLDGASEPATPITSMSEGNKSHSNNSNSNDPTSFLDALTHQVCALGVLDAENSFTASSSTSSAKKNNNNNNDSPRSPSSSSPVSSPTVSSSKAFILRGWASPIPASPSPSGRNNNNNNSNNFSELLPSFQEASELFAKCCQTLFAPTMTKLIQKATDPGQGEANCLKVLDLKMFTSGESSSSSSNAKELSKNIHSILTSDICQVVSAAAGRCILQHLSDCANKLIEMANSNSTQKNQQDQSSSTQQTLFHTIFAVIFQQSLESPLEPTSSSSASIRGRALLSSLVKRPPTSNKQGIQQQQQQQQQMSPSKRYHQLQLQQHLNNHTTSRRGMSSSRAGGAGRSLSPSGTASLLVEANLSKLNQLLVEIKAHAKSALQRSSAFSHADKSSEQVTEIISDLTMRLSESARVFITSSSSSSSSSSTSSPQSSGEQQQQQQQKSFSVKLGIAAAEAIRFVCEPLIKLAEETIQTGSNNNNNNNNNKTNNNNNASSPSLMSLKKATETLTLIQSEMLLSWKEETKASFEQECLERLQSSTSTAHAASGTELICRVEQQQQQGAASSSSSSGEKITFPNRPSPTVLIALVNVVRKVTSLFPSSSSSSAANNNNSIVSSSSSSIFATSTTTSCPKHIRFDLCAELCSIILKKGSQRIDDIKKNINSIDQKLLQLYFDVCFVVLVLRGTTSSLQQQSFTTVDVLRKDFTKKIETSVDVLTWSVSKSSINSAIKAAVDDSACITSAVLPSSSSTGATKSSLGAVKTNALKMSVETPSDRLPLLPLVALAPSSSSSSANSANNNNNASGNPLLASLYNQDSSSISSGGDNNTVERAAKELMAQGTAFTSKLKSVFQW